MSAPDMATLKQESSVPAPESRSFCLSGILTSLLWGPMKRLFHLNSSVSWHTDSTDDTGREETSITKSPLRTYFQYLSHTTRPYLLNIPPPSPSSSKLRTHSLHTGLWRVSESDLQGHIYWYGACCLLGGIKYHLLLLNVLAMHTVSQKWPLRKHDCCRLRENT